MAIGTNISSVIPTNHIVVYRPTLTKGFSTAGKKSLSLLLVKIGISLSFTPNIYA